MKTQSQIKPLGRLTPESESERRSVASIGEADIAELRSRVRRFTRSGGVVLDEAGNVSITEAALTKRLLLGDEQ